MDLIVREGIPAVEAARLLGVSKKTVYKWLARHDEPVCPTGAEGGRASRTRRAQLFRLLIELREETGDGPRQLLWLARRR